MILEASKQDFWIDEESSRDFAEDINTGCKSIPDGAVTVNKPSHSIKSEMKPSTCSVRNANISTSSLSKQQISMDILELARFSVQSMANLVQSFYDFFIRFDCTAGTQYTTCNGAPVQYWTSFIYGCSGCQKDRTHCEVNLCQTKYTLIHDGAQFPRSSSQNHPTKQRSSRKSCDISTNHQQTWTLNRLLLSLILLLSFSLTADGINSVHAPNKPCQIVTASTTLTYERYPGNCSMFYICRGSNYWTKSCQKQDTVFSFKHKVCVWKNSIFDDCQEENVIKFPTPSSILEKDLKFQRSPQDIKSNVKLLDKADAITVGKNYHSIHKLFPEMPKAQEQVPHLFEPTGTNNNNNYLNTQVRGYASYSTTNHNFAKNDHRSSSYNDSPKWYLDITSKMSHFRTVVPNREQPELADTRIISRHFDNELQAGRHNLIRNNNFVHNNRIGNIVLKNSPKKSELKYNNNIEINADVDWTIVKDDVMTRSGQKYDDDVENDALPFLRKESLVRATDLSYNDNFLEKTNHLSKNIEYKDRQRQKQYFQEENTDTKIKGNYSSNESIKDVDSQEGGDEDNDSSRSHSLITDYDSSEAGSVSEFNPESKKSVKDMREDLDSESQEDKFESEESANLPYLDKARSPVYLNQNKNTNLEVGGNLPRRKESDNRNRDENTYGLVSKHSLPLDKSWLQISQPTAITQRKDKSAGVRDIPKSGVRDVPKGGVQDVLEGTRIQKNQYESNVGSPLWKRNSQTRHIRNIHFPKSKEDSGEGSANLFGLRHNQFGHFDNKKHNEFEENSSFQRNDRRDEVPYTLSKSNKNGQIIPTERYKENKESAVRYFKNRDTYTTKGQIIQGTFLNPPVTKPSRKVPSDNVLVVRPWPGLNKKLSQTLVTEKFTKQTQKPLSQDKAVDNPNLMQKFLRLLNLSDQRKDSPITKVKDSIITKNRKNKYNDENIHNKLKVTTNKFWPPQRTTQNWVHNFQNKQTITKSPVLNRFVTSTPNPGRSNLRFSKNQNIKINPPHPSVKYEDHQTTKNKGRFIFGQDQNRNTFHGKHQEQEQNRNTFHGKHQEQNQYLLPQRQQNKQRNYQQERNIKLSQEKLQDKKKSQEDLRNKNPFYSLRNDYPKSHQPWFWKSQPKNRNNLNDQNTKLDNKYNQYFENPNDKKPPSFLHHEQLQKTNLHHFQMKPSPTPKFDSNEVEEKDSFELEQKRKIIKNKINYVNLKNNKKENYLKQKQIHLHLKLNRTIEKRPEWKPTSYPISDSENGVDYDKSTWKYDPKSSFEAQTVTEYSVPLPTATTSKMTSTTEKITTTRAQETTTTRHEERTPSSSNDPDYVPIYRQELKDRCGIMATPLIIGGQSSRTDQWPWQVSLQIVTSTTPWHRCGGVLVHPKWVLTAAHCMEGPFYGDVTNWRVVMADYDLEYVSGSEIYRDIVRVISHPGYARTSNFPNDVALLELDTPLDLTSGEVQTACLPDTDFTLSPGTQCWISGWGETRGTGGQDNTMNEVLVEVLPHDTCKSMWGRVNIDVLDSQVCLGYGLTGACYGDSGGPLMCESDGRFYVAGVMSWLINNCSANNFPNVFTRLPNYMDWVYQELDHFEWLQFTL